ncbi:selenide, water dikinase SelD [Desulfatiferula olefinivorans]
MGLDTPDDAGVVRLTDEIALIQTLDFLTPITDSPYDFGRIAAANSLSDVYAMGGVPITAMNIVCFSVDEFPESVLRETLAGGLEKIHEAGALLVGGHSVDDREFKYGLSVTGRVHPSRVLTNAGARVGDALILTKPLGTGILSTAIKGKFADDGAVKLLVDTASELNRTAAEIMAAFDVSACTDVTGFGLAGHVLEMARGGKKSFLIHGSLVPMLDKAREYALLGLIPAGAYKTRSFCEHRIRIAETVDAVTADLMFDPQTSGGLLLCLPEAQAADCLARMHDRGVPAVVVGCVENDHPEGLVRVV